MYTFSVFDNTLNRYVHLRLSNKNQGELDVVRCEKAQRMQEFSEADLKYRDEKLKLQAVVADLTQVNRRWQRYNNDMQIYIKKLQATIEDQQEQLNTMADKRAEHLFHPNQEEKRGEASCKKCQPLIEYLRQRVTSLESDLVASHTCQPYSLPDPTSELLSLQLRLRKAWDYIDHLNRLLVSKGILKPSHNFLPVFPENLAVTVCSKDGLKFYECDSESLNSNTPMNIKGLCSKSEAMEATFWSDPSTTYKGTDDETYQRITANDPSKEDCLTKSPSGTSLLLNISDKFNNGSISIHTSENISKNVPDFEQSLKDLNTNKNTQDVFKDASDCLWKEDSSKENSTIKIPPDRLNKGPLAGDGQCSSSSGSCMIDVSLLDGTSRCNMLPIDDVYCNSFIDNPLCFHNLPTDGSSNNLTFVCTDKLNPPLNSANYNSSSLSKTDIYWNVDNIVKSREGSDLGARLPFICPHCEIVFPPNSEDSYDRHIVSCQYL